MIGKVIHNLLSTDAAVNNLVSAKIFPIIVPQNTLFPAVTYETIDTQPLEVVGYQKIADTTDIQINIFADTYIKVIEIKNAIQAALDFKNNFQNSSVNVCGITPRGDFDGDYDKKLNLYHRILKYEISINQPYTI